MPGVPPETVENVKKLLKGIFKRGRNKKQDKTNEAVTSEQTPSAPDTSSDTPIASAQLDKPQEDTSVKTDAQPGLSGNAVAATGQPGSETVAPASLAATSNAPSEPVSTIDGNAKPVLGEKTAEETTDVAKSQDVLSKEDVDPATATKSAAPTENAPVQANGTSEGQPAEIQEIPVVAAASDVKTSEEQVPVQPEPPAIPKSQPAPGMSATSGPLEDFPEHGDGTKE